MKTILVIAAHPDDEVLGCGATIAKHVQSGDEVHVVILAEGATSRDKRRDRSLRATDLSLLTESANRAKEILGVTSLTLYDYPDNRMDSVDRLDIVKTVESCLDRVNPDTVYTHHAGDMNIDHRRTHEAVVTACRPHPQQSVSTLLFFEVPSSTEWQLPGGDQPFIPNWYMDISDTLAIKLEALQAYAAEMRPWPHSRSYKTVEILARWRGSSVGVEAAEAFIVGRNLVKWSSSWLK